MKTKKRWISKFRKLWNRHQVKMHNLRHLFKVTDLYLADQVATNMSSNSNMRSNYCLLDKLNTLITTIVIEIVIILQIWVWMEVMVEGIWQDQEPTAIVASDLTDNSYLTHNHNKWVLAWEWMELLMLETKLRTFTQISCKLNA
jgi:hypothetical protein